MSKERVNLFDVIPFVSEHITTVKEGELSVIAFPRFPNKILQKCLVRFTKSEYIHICLDKNGTEVWDRIDGKRTVREICCVLAEDFGNEENYESRVAIFVSQLRANRFVKYKMLV